MKSFKQWQGKQILGRDKTPFTGELKEENCTLRITNGFLSDVYKGKDSNNKDIILPAVESNDFTHVEHWKDGLLHCEKEPAIIDVKEDYEEWWVNGVNISQGILYTYDGKILN